MSDLLDITDEEAEGLARLAQAQLRLATRLSERALDAADDDAACRLARASERVARGYRQSLLLKARLKRDAETARREAIARPLPPTPQHEARIYQRIRDVHARVDRILVEQPEALDPDDVQDIRVCLMDALEEDAKDPGFLAEPIELQAERMCDLFDLQRPVGEAPATPDSS